MSTAIDIDELKRRAAPQVAAPVAAQAAPQMRQLPRNLASELATFEQAVLEENTPAETRVDLGPLPPEAQAKVDAIKEKTPPPSMREKIEKACSPLDFGQLLLTGRVTQHVKVLPGKVEIKLRSLTGAEEFWLEKHQLDQPPEFAAAWKTYTRLAMSVQEMNGVESLEYLQAGKIDAQVLEARLQKLLQLPASLFSLLVTHLSWFYDRVANLYDNDFDAIKNG